MNFHGGESLLRIVIIVQCGWKVLEQDDLEDFVH